MKTKAISVSLAIVLMTVAGCGKEKAENDVKAEFSKKINDPASLQFSNLIHYSDGTVCGDYNAKNKMGGYVGFRKFIYNPKGVFRDDYKHFYGDPRLLLETYSSVTIMLDKLVFEGDEDNIKITTKDVWCKDGDYDKKYLYLMGKAADKVLSGYTEEKVLKSEKECLDRKSANDALQKKVESGKLDPSDAFADTRLVFERRSESMICDSAKRDRKIWDWAPKDLAYVKSDGKR